MDICIQVIPPTVALTIFTILMLYKIYPSKCSVVASTVQIKAFIALLSC